MQRCYISLTQEYVAEVNRGLQTGWTQFPRSRLLHSETVLAWQSLGPVKE